MIAIIQNNNTFITVIFLKDIIIYCHILNYKPFTSHSKLVFLSELKKCSHKCYEVLLHGVKPKPNDHPEGGPAVCSSDNGTRRRVRSVWPSGGAHLPQGTGLKRRRRARRRTKGEGRIRPDRYTNAYTTVRARWVHPPARMHARTFSCSHARTHGRTHARMHPPGDP